MRYQQEKTTNQGARDWDCDFCIEKGFQSTRNCGGKYPDSGAVFTVFNIDLGQCPISLLDPDSVDIIQLVEDCEGEMGGHRSPTAWLEETAYYHTVRKIVLGEKYRLGKLKNKKGK